jgi:hypothetical protein
LYLSKTLSVVLCAPSLVPTIILFEAENEPRCNPRRQCFARLDVRRL